jgi:hypothetical protein
MILLLAACASPRRSDKGSGDDSLARMRPVQLPPDTLYDRLLGMLTGSAIGDAMGAPTEMWNRDMIQAEYGHVSGPDAMVREPSPEGTWMYNPPAGGTTDDTRWKRLTLEYLAGSAEHPHARPAQVNSADFARFMMEAYQAELDSLKDVQAFSSEPYDAALRRALWLREWAEVAKAYIEGDLDGYAVALNKFYGGELVCGGMLFAPLTGAAWPGDPAWAYEQTYRMNIFDIGFARDIAGITAAMTSACFLPGATPDSVLAVIREVDPKGYYQSRLVGRTAYFLYREALYIAHEAGKAADNPVELPEGIRLALPRRTPEEKSRYARWAHAYQLLDERLQRLPFHPGEIYLIALTGMMVCDFDFRETMEFITNYGRDNDTVGAVAGGILGAFHGYAKLPADWKKKVEATAPLQGYDLPAMAQRLQQSIQPAQ